MEVKIDILQAISEGAGRPTHIMYRSNLSWSVMQGFIRALEQQELISAKEGEGRRNYILTAKGRRVLDNYMDVRKQLGPLVVTEAGRIETVSAEV
jgi:predicted transcriptional regulator